MANSAGAVLKHILESRDFQHGLHAEIIKGVPPGRGLGSSGASAAAAAYSTNRLLNLGLTRGELVKLAALGEAAVAGSAHADNVSASLLGGFVIVDFDYDVIRLEPPDIGIVIAVPEIIYESKTKLARALLPESVRFKEAVLNVGKASRMAAAVALNDPILFGKSICDNLVEPVRAKIIPNFWRVKDKALEAGALGCSIAGGGPSVFAVGENLVEIGNAMSEAFEEAGVKCSIYFTKPSVEGVRMV